MQNNQKKRANQVDIYSQITSKIIEELEQGVRPWVKPWSGGGEVMRPLRHNGEIYSGINVLILWMEAQTRGYVQPTWMTFKQAKSLKASVKKGEQGARTVYSNRATKKEVLEDGEEVADNYWYLKQYTVFNIEQIEGLPDSYYGKNEPIKRDIKRLKRVDDFVELTDARVKTGGFRAFYHPGSDYIQMPEVQYFKDSEAYASVLLHELTHWTGHRSRLERSFKGSSFGSPEYAREKLIAELGAAYLCADLGVAPDGEVRADHAGYIETWISVLREDKRAIFRAAAEAEKAVGFLHDIQTKQSLSA